LRQLGADVIEGVAIAAKGNRAKVVQLMDYVNDRPEMLKLRGGRQVGAEVEAMANVRSCVALLRKNCNSSEADQIISNVEMACCSREDTSSLSAKSRAVLGSDSGGGRGSSSRKQVRRGGRSKITC
jgi:hypothetical protein